VILADEATLAAQQCAKLEERENERLRKNKQNSRLMKAAVLVSAIAFIGLSLPVFHAHEEVFAQSAAVSQPTRATAKQAGENVIPIAQAESRIEQVKPASYLVLGGLKLTDQLGQKN